MLISGCEVGKKQEPCYLDRWDNSLLLMKGVIQLRHGVMSKRWGPRAALLLFTYLQRGQTGFLNASFTIITMQLFSRALSKRGVYDLRFTPDWD